MHVRNVLPSLSSDGSDVKDGNESPVNDTEGTSANDGVGARRAEIDASNTIPGRSRSSSRAQTANPYLARVVE